MVDRPGITNLADDQIVADSRLHQRYNIRYRQRLTLFDPLYGLRRLRAQMSLLGLIQSAMPDYTTYDCTHRRTY